MNYLLQNRQSSARRRANTFARLVRFIVVVVVVLLIILSPLRSVLVRIVSPLWAGENALATYVRERAHIFSSKESLILENQALRAAKSKDSLALYLAEQIKRENVELKELLGRKEKIGDSLLAVVLAKPTLLPYDTLLVDVGSAEGVEKGDLVIVQGTDVLGKITETTTHTSKVTLFSSPKERTPVHIGEHDFLTEAVGIGGGNFTAQLPREIEVREGDKITLTGVRPLLFGIVEDIATRPTDAFQTVRFKNPVNMNELQFVEVLVGGKTRANPYYVGENK